MRLALVSSLVLLAAACESIRISGPDAADLADIARLEDLRADPNGELRRLTTSASPEVRTKAATALGRLWFPEAGAEVTRALLALLTDANEDVRASAAFALGMRGDASAADKLLFVALDEHERDPSSVVRARALEAASKLERSELRLQVLRGLDDADASVRVEAAQGASRWSTKEPNAAEVSARLVAQLEREESAGVLTALLFTLDRRKTEGAAASFRRFASSDDAEQRIAAVRGLRWSPREPESAAALVRVCDDGDTRVVCEALIGLRELDGDAGFAALAKCAEHTNANVRRTAWETIAARVQRDAGAANGLRAHGVELGVMRAFAPSERSAWVRGARVEAALRSLVHEQSSGERVERELAELQRIYSSLSREERIGVLRGYSAFGAERALPVLMECIKDPDFAVGGVAIELLGKFDPARVRAALHAALGFGDNGLRLAAATVLTESATAEDFEALRQCYETSQGDGANEIRFNVLRAAAKGGGEAARDLLLAGCVDRNAFVRRVARVELERVAPGALRSFEALDLEFERGSDAALPPPLGTNPLVEVRTTKGTLRFELLADEAPLHVHNFLEQARRDRYDGTLWHRVVPDFVIQGGDYRGDGNGGGTWQGDSESLRHEIGPRKYARGSLGMPRNEDPDSGGSQIFVTHRATPHLDGRYTIFGELRAGFEVLDAIEVGDKIVDVRVIR
jgi:cyclophilin family peptidyl-prolyl cis-trans isomerase/HEAT repeat protein